MNPHDAISDDGERVECACGRLFEGPKAREQHATHFHIERARAALRGEREETVKLKVSAYWPDEVEIVRASWAAAGLHLIVACLEPKHRETGVPRQVLIDTYGATHEVIEECRQLDLLWEASPGCVVANPVVGDLRYSEVGRPHIPVDVRREVMDRDGHRCLDCGSTKHLSLDHIVPFSHGGPDTVENLRVLCRPCNSRRGNRV